MTKPRIILLAALGAALVACAPLEPAPSAAQPSASAEARTARYFDDVRDRPPLLEAFLRRFPKGGDLHNHLSGAVYAESYIAWASADGLCIERKSFTLMPPPCNPAKGTPQVKDAVSDGSFYSATIDALSMRNFTPGAQSGHDHFFATFGKFKAAEGGREGDMLAEATARAADNAVGYLELMLSPGMAEARKLGAAVGWSEDLAQLREKLRARGIAAIVASARRQLDRDEARMRDLLHCETPVASPGCAVTVRYLAQVIRTFPPEAVFAQALLAHELAAADPRVVGLNLVAPEDDRVTLRDYDVQMRMLGFLGKAYPGVKLTLHAGELVWGLVPPEALRFHIRQAVEVAGARRIGHGVDIMAEDDPYALLEEMARLRVTVEINLTSNVQILGISGARHPFPIYRQFGVPVALSTDDEGVERIDLTREYMRAVESYKLGYAELKTLARNSLEYAFLPGPSLWSSLEPPAPVPSCAGQPAGASVPSADCGGFLAGSEKAREEWRLEAAFAAFEKSAWPLK